MKLFNRFSKKWKQSQKTIAEQEILSQKIFTAEVISGFIKRREVIKISMN